MPNYAPSEKIIVRASFASVREGQIRRAGPEIANLPANAEVPKAPPEVIYVQPDSALKHAGGGGAPRVCAVVDKTFVFAEVAEAAAEAHPRGNCRSWKQM